MAQTIVREYPVVCSNCGGTGTVCSYGTTTAFKTCPVCNGTGVITIKETIFEGNENNIINEHYHMAKRTEMEKQNHKEKMREDIMNIIISYHCELPDNIVFLPENAKKVIDEYLNTLNTK